MDRELEEFLRSRFLQACSFSVLFTSVKEFDDFPGAA